MRLLRGRPSYRESWAQILRAQVITGPLLIQAYLYQSQPPPPPKKSGGLCLLDEILENVTSLCFKVIFHLLETITLKTQGNLIR